MQRSTVTLMLVSLLCGLYGCATPDVSTSIQKQRAARGPGCNIKFVEVSSNPFEVHENWEIIGNVHISSRDNPEPGTEEMRNIIRKEACEMGGSAASLTHHSEASRRGYNDNTSYVILNPEEDAGSGETETERESDYDI